MEETLFKLIEVAGVPATITLVSLYLAYKIINKIIENKKIEDKKEHTRLVEKRETVGREIQTMLNDLIKETGASRATVYEYHNGEQGAGGLPFMRMTNTYEARNLGVYSNQDMFMDVSTFLYNEFIDAVRRNNCLVMDMMDNDSDKVIGTISRETFLVQGVEKIATVRIVGEDNEIIGYTSLEYEDREKYKEEHLQPLKIAAGKFSKLLTIKEGKQ